MAAIADSTSFKATAYRRDLARRLGLAGFGRWWARELAALMPAAIRSGIERRRMRPVLMFDGNVATLWRPAQANGRVQMTEATRIALDGDAQAVVAAGRSALAPLAVNGAAPHVVVALPPRASLRKTLTLPAALEDNLHQALAYDLDRHTPFKADELYFDAVIVDRDSARNTLRVDLAAVRRALVDPMLRHANAFGARVIGVSVDSPPTAAASPLNLLPVDRRVPVLDWTRWQVIVPAALVVAGLLAALILPVWQKREEVIELNVLSEEARQRAAVSESLRTELERRVSDYNFALQRKYAFPGVVQVLDDVTRILPDDTWLTQLEVHSGRGKDQQRELTLRGESANAGRLVTLLEDSKVFAQAAPRSPTTKIQPGPGEIFDVGAQLKPLPPPLALPIDVTAPPPPPRPPSRSRPAPSAAAPAAPATSAPAASATATPAAPNGPTTRARASAPGPAQTPSGGRTAPGTSAASTPRPPVQPPATAPEPAQEPAATEEGDAAPATENSQ